MDNERRADDPEKLEQHSLPGTNMAGKKAGDDCEKPADEDQPSEKPVANRQEKK